MHSRKVSRVRDSDKSPLAANQWQICVSVTAGDYTLALGRLACLTLLWDGYYPFSDDPWVTDRCFVLAGAQHPVAQGIGRFAEYGDG